MKNKNDEDVKREDDKKTVTLIPEDHRNLSHLEMLPELVQEKLKSSETVIIALEQDKNCFTPIELIAKQEIIEERRRQPETSEKKLTTLSSQWTYDDNPYTKESLSQAESYINALKNISEKLTSNQKIIIAPVDQDQKDYTSTKRDTSMANNIDKAFKMDKKANSVVMCVGASHIYDETDKKQGKRLGTQIAQKGYNLELKNLYAPETKIFDRDKQELINIHQEIEQIIEQCKLTNAQMVQEERSELKFEEGVKSKRKDKKQEKYSQKKDLPKKSEKEFLGKKRKKITQQHNISEELQKEASNIGQSLLSQKKVGNVQQQNVSSLKPPKKKVKKGNVLDI